MNLYVSFNKGVLNRRCLKTLIYIAFLTVVILLISNCKFFYSNENIKDVNAYANNEPTFNRYSPLIFVGGFPRSGTTLMRAMLDAHPDIRCGQETRVIPEVLIFKNNYYKDYEKERAIEAGVSEDVIDAAMSAFMLEVIVRHGEPAPYLCTKDPFILYSARYLSKLFPNAKFLFMVRDGRASIYSAILRNVTIEDDDLENVLHKAKWALLTSRRFVSTNWDVRDGLTKWNDSVAVMHEQCHAVGAERCMMVHYEQLVLHPRHWLQKVLAYLQVPWDEAVLHHEDKINNKHDGVRISRLEMSSDQVIKPVNVESLARWVGFYPEEVERDMGDIAPMLLQLGYDPRSGLPNYGTPDDIVLQNTRLIQSQPDYWREKAKHLNLAHTTFS